MLRYITVCQLVREEGVFGNVATNVDGHRAVAIPSRNDVRTLRLMCGRVVRERLPRPENHVDGLVGSVARRTVACVRVGEAQDEWGWQVDRNVVCAVCVSQTCRLGVGALGHVVGQQCILVEERRVVLPTVLVKVWRAGEHGEHRIRVDECIRAGHLADVLEAR